MKRSPLNRKAGLNRGYRPRSTLGSKNHESRGEERSQPQVYRFRKGKKRPASETRLMKEYRAAHPVCEACLREPTRDAHHIVSEKTGGPTVDWNLLGLCFFCHTNGFHLWGWKRFCDRFPHLAGKVVAARIRMGRKTT